MINAQGRLIVMEDFHTDRSLPKFQGKSSAPSQASTSSQDVRQGLGDPELWKAAYDGLSREDSMSESGSSGSNISINESGPNVIFNGSTDRFTIQGPDRPVPWYKRWFRRKEPAPSMSIEDFFKSVKNSAQELTIVQARAAGYEAALLNAKRAGQQAMVERLSAGLNAFRMEAQLTAIGLTKYVEEKDVVRFYKLSKKGLRLDWVRNFVRTIPEEVTARKVRADELGIFDNYAVLHYDPLSKSYAETEAEKERRKDPILFGLMKGRTQLYFVGDWVDEHCDLTLDQLAEAIGAGSVHTVGG